MVIIHKFLDGDIMHHACLPPRASPPCIEYQHYVYVRFNMAQMCMSLKKLRDKNAQKHFICVVFTRDDSMQ